MTVAELRPTAPGGWHARLDLELGLLGSRTVLVRRSHEGPLMVQRAFYPEPDGTAHVVVLHPPGGIAGGDILDLSIEVRSGARALLTTPAATKLYRTRGPLATVRQSLHVSTGATLEWLPQETLAFGGARAEMQTRVELEPGARYVGWDIACLGRPASGDDFDVGRLDQKTELWVGGKPLLVERLSVDARAASRRGPFGLGGRSAYGCLVAVGPAGGVVDALRALVRPSAEGDLFAVTDVGGAVVCRALGHGADRVRRLLEPAWVVAREHVLEKSPCQPRIWNT